MAAREARDRMDEARLALSQAREAVGDWSVASLDECRSRLEHAARLLAEGVEELRRRRGSQNTGEAADLREAVEACRGELGRVRAVHERGAALYRGWMALMASVAGAGYTPRGSDVWPALAGAGRRVRFDA